VILPSLPSTALRAITDMEGVRGYDVAPVAAKRIIEAALERLLPGMFLTVHAGDSTIWAEGEPPEALLTRTASNAQLFDALAVLLQDRSDDEPEEG
jgi:hypothetical protein